MVVSFFLINFVKPFHYFCTWQFILNKSLKLLELKCYFSFPYSNCSFYSKPISRPIFPLSFFCRLNYPNKVPITSLRLFLYLKYKPFGLVLRHDVLWVLFELTHCLRHHQFCLSVQVLSGKNYQRCLCPIIVLLPLPTNIIHVLISTQSNKVIASE